MSEMFGPYRLVELLGRGGQAEVWRAHDTRRNGEVVALKRFSGEVSGDRYLRSLCRREVAITSLLDEPHIVPVHDFGEIDGRLYLDMRLIEGDSLATLLGRDGPFEPQRAVDLVEQVAAALDAAHARDLVHRDIKPANVLVEPGPPERAYLADFGLARPTLRPSSQS